MKKYTKWIAMLLAMLMLTALAGCGIDRDEGKARFESFLTAISAGDYDSASAFLHPALTDEWAAFSGQLKDVFPEGADEIAVQKYTGFSSSAYTSDVGGSQLTLRGTLTVGDQVRHFEVQLVDNDAGYGIYAFEVE